MSILNNIPKGLLYGRRKMALLLLVMLFIASLISMAIQPTQEPGQANQLSNRQNENNVITQFEDYPVADLNSPEPADPEERAMRRVRNEYHNNPNVSAVDAENFRIKEDTNPVNLGVPSAHSPAESALPVIQSDAVAIGKVIDARAHLSSDKINVYSEFNVCLEEVLKDFSAEPLKPGISITTERLGGRVRLPSGKVILIGYKHRSMPLPGARYVLFLKYNRGIKTYSIITGYELRGGRVSPLDGHRRFLTGEKYSQLVEYDRFEGMSATTLLREVKEVVARTLNQ
jgi:hypothetical protein